MSTAAKVAPDQRHTPAHPCPTCGSHDRAPRGQGERCHGYRSGDGRLNFCGRVESPETIETAAGPLFKHRLRGDCPCGQQHAPPDPIDRRMASKPRKGYRTPQEAAKGLGRGLGRLAGNWTYNNVPGRPPAIVYRFQAVGGAKTYRPVHRNGDGLWHVGDPPGPLPLYQLHDFEDARLVVVCEGEKPTDAIRSLGMVATTSMHGAQSPHRSDWSPLAGKTVVILPDADEPGERYADAVAGLLAKLDPPPTVKVVRLPGLPPGGDAVEWIEGGGTAGDLMALVESTRPAGPPSNPAPEPAAASDDGPLPWTEFGLAERFVLQHGRDVRFCHAWGKWLVWDSRRWKVDDKARVRLLAKLTIRSLYAEAASIADDDKRKEFLKWAASCERKRAIDAMLALVEFHEGIPITTDEMDRDPWLLNCPNGTLDIRANRLRPHDRGDCLTKLCPVEFDPAAECPLWLATLAKFLPSEELRAYLQRLAGYAITGVIRDHVLPIAHGIGSNGKSTILGALLDVLGPDLAMKAPPDLLLARAGDEHPTGRASLFGKRLVIAIETEEGGRLNESLIKELTGGDTVTARRMREDYWSFAPTHKIVMATNHKPAVRGTDHGIWRRLKLIPFAVTVADGEADKAMPERLKGEAPGILAWCVRGCLEWQQEGLGEPEAVASATHAYRQDEDVLGAFIRERCVIHPSARIQAGELHAAYKAWAETVGQGVLSIVRFGKSISERGFEKSGSKYIFYQGIELRSGHDDTDEEVRDL